MDDNDGEEEWDWEGDDEPINVKSLFCDKTFDSLEAMILYDTNEYDFNLKQVIISEKFDEIELIMLINYVRSWAAQNTESIKNEIANLNINIKNSVHNNDIYMKPTLDNDSLLYLVHNIHVTENDDESDSEPSAINKLSNNVASEDHQYSTEEVKEKMIAFQKLMSNALCEPDKSDDINDSSSYFNSYFNSDIHETMLKDTARMKAYSEALTDSYVQGKVVLDIGCGTGILCLLAAKAGATKVIGVEYTKISEKAVKISERNNLSHIITIVNGSAENAIVPLDENEKVDIIVSEWMGYGLYFENMLPSVLVARDKYLSPNGMILPNISSLFIQGMSTKDIESDRVEWWSQINGFNLCDMNDLVIENAQVQEVYTDDICTNRCCFHTLDLNITSDEDLDFNSHFTLNAESSQIFKAFVLSFDVFFNDSRLKNETILSTAVEEIQTHWKQVVLWLEICNRCTVTPSTVIMGEVRYQRNDNNKRGYTIDVYWNVNQNVTSVEQNSNQASQSVEKKFMYHQTYLLN